MDVARQSGGKAPSAARAWLIVLLFLLAIYHFDQTTEFLYYQF